MNPINLLLPDGKPSTVWACGECGRACDSHEHAEKCCGPAPCRFCGEPTKKKYRLGCYEYHDACWQKNRDAQEAAWLEKAEKLETWGGWVYEDGRGSNEGYFESVEDYIEHLVGYDGLEPEDWPDYVHVAVPSPGCELDIGHILENACENGYEDMDDDLSGTKELEAAINAFNKANEGVLVYNVDLKRAVRVPKPTEAHQ